MQRYIVLTKIEILNKEARRCKSVRQKSGFCYNCKLK